MKLRTSIAAKARELLTDLHDLACNCPHCGGELGEPTSRWIRLDSFDPPHGVSEISYARTRGFLEHDTDPTRVRITEAGVRYIKTKPRSDSYAGKAKNSDHG
jgi:hypothetical protein